MWEASLPLIGSWLISLFSYKFKNSNYRHAWFRPPAIVFSIAWSAFYIILGVLLWKTYNNDNRIFWLLTTIVLLCYAWQYIFVVMQDYKLAMWDLLLILLISYWTQSELYYSDAVVDNQYYSHIFALFVGWITIAIIISSHSYDIKLKPYKSRIY